MAESDLMQQKAQGGSYRNFLSPETSEETKSIYDSLKDHVTKKKAASFIGQQNFAPDSLCQVPNVTSPPLMTEPAIEQ